jgi:hypothetical protein
MAHTKEKKQPIESVPEGAQLLEFSKDFKLATTNIFEQLKETIFKELKKSVVTIFYQIKNSNKGTEF